MHYLALGRLAPFRSATTIVATLLAVLVGTAILRACNVPVFRYALERWHPDAYRLTVLHRGPLDESQRKTIEALETSAASDSNIAVRVVDADRIESDEDRALLAAQASPNFPWLAVQYPRGLRIEPTVWAGPLAEADVARLVASPVRTELIRRLAAGQTAVWLLLESGDAAKDAAAATLLEAELKKLPTKLELPELTSAPEDNLLSDAPLELNFSLLRVTRGDAEQPLVETLLHSESDLKDFAEPMVFPVFGRGRAFPPLVGAGITADNIHESAAFLVGACSCEVKELNPGFDLLLKADWNVLLFKEAAPPEAIAARTAAASGPPELVAIPVGASATPVAMENEESALEFHYEAVGIRTIGIAALAVAAIAVLLVFAFRRGV